MLTIGVKEDEIVQLWNGTEQILLRVKRDGKIVRMGIMADKSWKVHRGTIEEAKK